MTLHLLFCGNIMDATSALPPAAAALGISSSGRQYHYREFRYDRLADALAYAKLDRARPGYSAPSVEVPCEQLPGPTAEDDVHMAAHGIRYERGRYLYGPYRYDLLACALDYARREPGLACATDETAREGGNR